MTESENDSSASRNPFSGIEPVPTGLMRRLGAIFYDSILLFAVLFGCVGVALIFVDNKAVESGNPFMTLFILVVAQLFFGWFWTHGGQTLGMQTWRVRIVSADGGAISVGQAIKRFLAALLSWSVFGLGFLWALFDRDKRTWHDLLSGTRLNFYPKPSKAAKPGK